MEKYLLFTNGNGSADPLNWSRDEAALYPVSKFLGIRPTSSTTLEMYFEDNNIVILKIQNGYHVDCMNTIGTAISKGSTAVIPIADVDNSRFASQYIYGCIIV